MKQLTIIVLLMFTFFAANAKNLHQHEPASEKLALNNGSKWKIDEPTRNNVINLQQIVKAANGQTHRSLKDYHNTGFILQTVITKMIKECRMKGPDHLALHKWLEPLMEQVIQINRATNVASAKKCFDEIKNRLTIFDQYFGV